MYRSRWAIFVRWARVQRAASSLLLVASIILVVICSSPVVSNHPGWASEQQSVSLNDNVSANFLTYEYADYGVKIDYPDTWELEEFAFDDRHFQIHAGHLPGLPLQLFYRQNLIFVLTERKFLYLGSTHHLRRTKKFQTQNFL